jgi:transcriptional antiterminator NusG
MGEAAAENEEKAREAAVDSGEPGAGEAVAAPEAPKVGGKPGMKWYVLHTYSGYEKKVKEALGERLKQHGMLERLGEILIPVEDVVEIKSGKKRKSSRMFFPGYVLIEMIMDERIWYVVKETPRITGFLGDSIMPTPLTDDEVVRIKDQMAGSHDKPRPKFSYNVGESVRVTEGPFANFAGVLEEVNMDRGKVKVMVTIFGRATPVELEFSQIEKV